MYRLSLLLLTLVPLALSQSVRTTVSCLSDGQCFTDRGEDAVCGKLESSATANLPVVGGSGEDYIIRIDLSAPLPDDPNPVTEKPCIGKECPINTSSECERPNQGGCAGEPLQESFAGDPRNPPLGGVGCETPAFGRRCNACCVQTDIVLRSRFSDNRSGPRKERDGRCEREFEKRCEDQELGDEEALRRSKSSSRRDCFSNAPLGFYRTPRRRFFQRCTQLSRRFCGNGLRLCRSFS